MSLKWFIYFSGVLIMLMPQQGRSVGKLDFLAGGYSITAKSATSEGSLSGVGVYVLSYRYVLRPSLELGLGYSLTATKTISGDLEYGPDFCLTYYPLTASTAESFKTTDVHYISQALWRPYIEGTFHQRQYQSTSTAYAGFGAGLGAEYQFNSRYSIKGAFRYLGLSGPSNSSAKEMNFLLGVSYPF